MKYSAASHPGETGASLTQATPQSEQKAEEAADQKRNEKRTFPGKTKVGLRRFLMRVECIANTVSALTLNHNEAEYYKKAYPGGAFDLDIGTEYTVYAMSCSHGCVHYYLLGEDLKDSPRNYPASLFRIADSRLPQSWGCHSTVYGGKNFVVIFAFEAWMSNPRFFELLVNGDPDTVKEWQQARHLIDREAAES